MTTFWEKAVHSVGHLFSLYFVYLWFWLFLILVLRAGFAFWLLHLLFIAFSLLFFLKPKPRYDQTSFLWTVSLHLKDFYFYYNWLLLQLDVVPCGGRKKIPALIHSVNYIFLLFIWDHGIYSENSEMIICLDESSKQSWNIFVVFDLSQSFRRLPC